MNDYAAGMHRGAEIAREMAKMGKNCGAKPCCVGASEAIARAILAEADEEVTPSAEVCGTCGQSVRQRTVTLP